MSSAREEEKKIDAEMRRRRSSRRRRAPRARSPPAASAPPAPLATTSRKEGRRATRRYGGVPEMGGASASASSGAGADERPKGEDGKQGQVAAGAQPPAGGKKRGRTAGDKEQNRLKRLLRNHVSAQQARERKKAYLTELEAKAKGLELRNAELEQRVSTLQNENNTLRQVIDVSGKEFKFTWASGRGELCDIYEERQSGEDGNGLLLECGSTWRK
eukprot:XP_020400780.1 putative bZIP transcription factor superfamily protein isoform X1 [Zea mays]